jgi:hypothetical protein
MPDTSGTSCKLDISKAIGIDAGHQWQHLMQGINGNMHACFVCVQA